MGSTKPLIVALIFATLQTVSLFGQNNLSKADKQFELGAYNLALETYKEILKTYNGNLNALVGAGDCYRLLNKMDAARQMYSKAIIHEDADPLVYDKLGQVLMALGEYEDAKKQFQAYDEKTNNVGHHLIKSCEFAMANQLEQSAYELNLEFENSSGSDFGPTFYDDGIIFSSTRTSSSKGYKSKPVSYSSNARSKVFVGDLNGYGHLDHISTLNPKWDQSLGQGPQHYCADKRLMVYTKNNFVDGTRHIPDAKLELSLHFAEMDAQGNIVKDYPFEHNGPGFSTGYGTLSTDGTMLVFASDRIDSSQGGFDLFVSFFENGTWSSPVNLGAKVNTAGNELAPYLMDKDLYFASDYHPGFGGLDIFVSSRDSRGYYSKPTNLGPQVNSTRDDSEFIFDPFQNLGFLVSNRVGGKGQEDLYSVKKNEDYLMLVVMDAASKAPIGDAIVDLSACGGSVFTTNNTGQFTYSMVKHGVCNIIISKPGFTQKEIAISNFGAMASNKLLVELVSLSSSYEFLVKEINTEKSINDALVSVQSVASGETFETYSDESGRIILPVNTGENYMIHVRAEGYLDLTKRIMVALGEDSRYVQGTFYLDPSLPDPIVQRSISKDEPVLNSYDRTLQSKSAAVFGYSTGYYIQVAALSTATEPKTDRYEQKLSGIADVHVVNEQGKYKVKVGPFASRKEASSYLGEVKSVGFYGAFIVTEELKESAPKQPLIIEDNKAELTPKGLIKEYQDADLDQAVSFEWAPAEAVKEVSEEQFFIQLGAIKTNTSNVDEAYKSLLDLGEISTKQRGEYYLKLLGGFSSKEEAKEVLKQVKERGFKDAFVH